MLSDRVRTVLSLASVLAPVSGALFLLLQERPVLAGIGLLVALFNGLLWLWRSHPIHVPGPVDKPKPPIVIPRNGGARG